MKKLSILMILLVGLMVFAGCSDDSTGGIITHKLTVNIADESEEAVEGAKVTVDGTEKETDSNGVVQFDLEDGDYTVEVTAEGYEDNSKQVTMNGEDETVDITLTAAQSTTEDFVLITSNSEEETDILIDYDHENNTGNIASDAWSSGTTITPEVTYNEKDCWELATGDGWGTVLAFMGDIYNTDQTAEFPADLTTDSVISFSVATTGDYDSLAVKVVGETDGNEKEITIDSFDNTSTDWQTVELTTDQFSSIEPANVDQLAIIAYGGTAESSKAYVTDYKISNTEVVIPKPEPDTYTLTVNVADESESAIEGATVAVNGTEDTTDASGAAQFDLPDGDYTVNVSAADYNDASQSVTINGADKSVDITLTASSDGTTNLVTNGDFATGDLTGWTDWSEGGTTVSVVDEAAVLDVTDIGGAWWSTQFEQEGIEVPAAGTYSISFAAKAATPRDIRLEIAPTDAAVAPKWMDFKLTDSMETYKANFDFSGLGDSPTFTVRFGLGAISENSAASTVTLDNVEVTEGSTSVSTSDLTVNVEDTNETALEGAEVAITQTATANPETTNSSGSATFSGLENRQYTVEASLDGYKTVSKAVVLSETNTVTLALEEETDATDEGYLYLTDETDSAWDGFVDLEGTIADWGSGTIKETDYTEDADYSPCIRIEYAGGDSWGIALPYGIEAGSLVGYDIMKFKVKTSDYTEVAVKLSGADTPEIVHDLANGEDLANGWKELTIDLADYGSLADVDEVAILNNTEVETEGEEILLTDIYFGFSN